MRDTWNAALYPSLDEEYQKGASVVPPDAWVHKNRMSALWGTGTDFEKFLQKEGITTLFFAGVNTDQCVGGTLTDAFSKGYDCILLTDGAATSSPASAQEAFEYNAAYTWGFLASCEDLLNSVAE
jgi:nicotinamidase-related amidase